jgi:hypothetical protein
MNRVVLIDLRADNNVSVFPGFKLHSLNSNAIIIYTFVKYLLLRSFKIMESSLETI